MSEQDLDKMSVVELKAMCFDQISVLEQTQNNIRVLNQKISDKMNAPVEKEKK